MSNKEIRLHEDLTEFERFILENLNYQELTSLRQYVEQLQRMYVKLYHIEKSNKEHIERMRTLVQMKEGHAHYKEMGIYLWSDYKPHWNKKINALYQNWKQELEYIDYLESILPKENRTYKLEYEGDGK